MHDNSTPTQHAATGRKCNAPQYAAKVRRRNAHRYRMVFGSQLQHPTAIASLLERRCMPTLFIDADACPVTREALAGARAARIPCVIAGNTTQNLERRIRRDDPRDADHARGRDNTHPGFWVEVLDVSTGADSADFAIIECLEPGDVVVTQDIGLASMALGRGAAAIGVRGHIYEKATIDMQLFIRHEEKKVRRAGGRTKGPSAFTDDDRERFTRNLAKLLKDALKAWERS